MVKQIVVLSGKGGTGKTTLTAAFTSIINKKIIIDCDVDAPNLYLLLQPRQIRSYEFVGGRKAFINKNLCSECRLCEYVCRFHAIKNLMVEPMSCEGCGFCYRICPSGSISFENSKTGTYYECELADSTRFYYARLMPGSGNSGKLISEIKRKAFTGISRDIEWIIIDGPPGIGCPVNASISGADYGVIVTEPTLSALHDLNRIVFLLKSFKINAGIIINKYDLNESITSEIYRFAGITEIPVVGQIPFQVEFFNALMLYKNFAEDSSLGESVKSIWKRICEQMSDRK